MKRALAVFVAGVVSITGGMVAAGPAAWAATPAATSAATSAVAPTGSVLIPDGRSDIFDGALTTGTKIIRLNEASAYPKPRPLWAKAYDAERYDHVDVPAIAGSHIVVPLLPRSGRGDWSVIAYNTTTGAKLTESSMDDYSEYQVDDNTLYLSHYDDDLSEQNIVAAEPPRRTTRWQHHSSPPLGRILTAGAKSGLFLRSGDGKMSTIHSIDPATGKLRWSTALDANGLDLRARVIGRGLFVAQRCGRIARLRIDTGALVWQRRSSCEASDTHWTPVAYGGRLYIQLSRTAIRVVDAATGGALARQAWDRMPVIDGRIGYFQRKGVLTAIDLKLRKTLWRLHATGNIADVTSARDGMVSVTSGAGATYLLDAWTGKVHWALHKPGTTLRGSIGGGIVAIPVRLKLGAYAP